MSIQSTNTQGEYLATAACSCPRGHGALDRAGSRVVVGGGAGAGLGGGGGWTRDRGRGARQLGAVYSGGVTVRAIAPVAGAAVRAVARRRAWVVGGRRAGAAGSQRPWRAGGRGVSAGVGGRRPACGHGGRAAYVGGGRGQRAGRWRARRRLCFKRAS
ncbi:glycine-rich cell wall structural protein 1.0-like [Miscanthus floridulus]|uniref:glycine-rich cell wall structural protein 1.0-like n=1 Tax=Miscanthus floridulus TaxID=154761 RepID=UPI0034574640